MVDIRTQNILSSQPDTAWLLQFPVPKYNELQGWAHAPSMQKHTQTEQTWLTTTEQQIWDQYHCRYCINKNITQKKWSNTDNMTLFSLASWWDSKLVSWPYTHIDISTCAHTSGSLSRRWPDLWYLQQSTLEFLQYPHLRPKISWHLASTSCILLTALSLSGSHIDNRVLLDSRSRPTASLEASLQTFSLCHI